MFKNAKNFGQQFFLRFWAAIMDLLIRNTEFSFF